MKHKKSGVQEFVDSISHVWGGIQGWGFPGAGALRWTCINPELHGDAPDGLPFL